MEIKVNGKVTTVYVSGRIDKLGAERLEKTLNQAASSDPSEVILDFEGVNFIGSSGIGKLLGFWNDISESGGKVRAINLSPEIKKLFGTVKLDKLFNI